MGSVLAIDAGTTGVRAFLVDHEGRPQGYRYQEFPQYFPQPGWVEHDANEIWQATETVCANVIAAYGTPEAIGITNQRETVVAWSRSTGQPISRAIVWQDRRTAAHCETLQRQGALEEIRQRTGLVLDPYFSGTKMAWLLQHGGIKPTDDVAFGTVDSWLVWKLTNGAVHATEPSNASRTMLYDIVAREWSPALGAILGVPLELLPEVRCSVGDFGVATTPWADGTPITGILGDQQAALFGQGCLQPGMAKNTFGTGSFVLSNLGETCPPPLDGLLTTVAWDLGSKAAPTDPRFVYALEGAIFVTGAAVQWLRDGLSLLPDAGAIEALASQVPDSKGLVLVPAFTGLGSPWWDPHARGTLLGISRGVTSAHLARAVLESMAFQTNDVLQAMAASGVPVEALRVDGGASANNLLLQLVADTTQVPVTRPVFTETTALGAAYAAGLGVGLWPSTATFASLWEADRVVSPLVGPGEIKPAYRQWKRAVDRSLHWSDAG